MKMLSFFFAAFALIASSIIPANAATALWEKQGAWEIYGDTSTDSCGAMVQYDNGLTLSVLFLDNTAAIAIVCTSVTKGQSYSVKVGVSTGEHGTLEAVASSNDTVMFLNINQNTVKALVKAQVIYIEGLGGFDLTGSKAAMASAWQCYETLNSF
ncbi:hypothetical protein [Mesorhizobium sp. M4B.F.Ca.ET.058.02.1.1]|uniref:hypothetical protein n=1 Tax=Mesorhizobium sp. M4B.F.Ca.ET.058.02.1.1 TaxID=2493675 RepID=UPI000F75644B|nr:hypothetical protein [Mesorhizobium sp. M4B.F.Ca.ET.058.02.1.1]AZO48066.1 hypothetical protein EJ073_09735 [Mesorhizobium sp. M4B.F.Ca.ET.058.02.1.1]TJX62381.1 MAG: hypothetical protein E5W21_12145 [Mesorhizobium sp.]